MENYSQFRHFFVQILYLFSQHVSRYFRVTQKFDIYGTMPVVKKFNNIYSIQINHFTQQTLLNQWLYYTIQYLEPNTKSKGGGNHHPPFVAYVTINSLLA